MKMQKFLDWCDENPHCTRKEWIKTFRKLGWTESSKFCSWHCHNSDHPVSKQFTLILNTPSLTHGESTEW